MVISNTDRPHPNLNLNGVELDKVSSYPQLGLVLNEKMNWEDHINCEITKANKKMGLMWKLSNDFPTICHWEYLHFLHQTSAWIWVYHQPQLHQRSGTKTRGLPEKGCPSLHQSLSPYKHRRTDGPNLRTVTSIPVKSCKMANGFAPACLQSLLPPRQGHHSNYSSRREHSFISVRANTNKLYNSFIPAAVRKWNSLDTTLKSIHTIGSFKNALRQSMFIKSVGYFSRCKGKAAVAHTCTRIRLGLSPLRYQLFSSAVPSGSGAFQMPTRPSSSASSALSAAATLRGGRANLRNASVTFSLFWYEASLGWH